MGTINLFRGKSKNKTNKAYCNGAKNTCAQGAVKCIKMMALYNIKFVVILQTNY